MNPEIQPPADRTSDLYRIWVLCSALEFLKQAAEQGSQFVSAKTLREFVRERTTTDDERDDIIQALRTAGAIDQLNRAGHGNKKYFLTDPIGVELLRTYSKVLRSKEKKTS